MPLFMLFAAIDVAADAFVDYFDDAAAMRRYAFIFDMLPRLLPC